MNDLIITNGRVIDPFSGADGEHNVVVHNGKIAGLEKGSKKRNGRHGVRVIDVEGAIVAPGFVDLHVHLREPGFEYKEDIKSGLKAAVAGGFTSVCSMPNTSPVNDNAGVTEYILKRASVLGLARIYPVGAISKELEGKAMADVGDQAGAGAVALSDDGRSVMNSLFMRRAAEYADTFNLPIIDHCEDMVLAANGVMNEGAVSTELGLLGIPAAAEEAHVARDIAIARLTCAHFHITHISTAASVEMVRAAKKKKINITCDVTPHHLTLTEESVRSYNTSFKMNPPLRTASDIKELIRGLADGTIDAVATDHAPHGLVDKELPFDSASFGVTGLETALPVLLKLVNEKKITLKKMIELLTCGLNALRGMNHSAGFKKGAVADITIFNPRMKVAIDSSKFYSKGRNTPFEGWKLNGKVLYTLVGGRVVFDHENGITTA